MNRASKWADIDSHIPYQGRVDVKIKKACKLSIRIPEWVEPFQCKATIGDQPRSLVFKGRYAQVGSVKPGDVVSLNFPISEKCYKIGWVGHNYNVVSKGNEIVSIDPPGKYCPFYQREHYRQNQTRWKKVRRFVPAQELDW